MYGSLPGPIATAFRSLYPKVRLRATHCDFHGICLFLGKRNRIQSGILGWVLASWPEYSHHFFAGAGIFWYVVNC